MRIGLVSDTHIPEVAKALPAELARALKGVDLIFHAGDIYSLSVLDDLQHIATVMAARGDDDLASTLSDARVKEKHVLKLGGKMVWLVHERPSYLKLSSAGEEKPDVVVFGHEHSVTVQKQNGTLLVCPGSPTFLHYCFGLGTVGILDIDSGEAKAEIIRL